jgi:hypothetical protein
MDLFTKELNRVLSETSYKVSTNTLPKRIFRVYENPAGDIINSILTSEGDAWQPLGGLITQGDLFVWPRDLATHDDILKELGISAASAVPFTASDKYITVSNWGYIDVEKAYQTVAKFRPFDKLERYDP